MMKSEIVFHVNGTSIILTVTLRQNKITFAKSRPSFFAVIANESRSLESFIFIEQENFVYENLK